MYDAGTIIDWLAHTIASRAVWVSGGSRSHTDYRIAFVTAAPISTLCRTIDPSPRTVRGGGFVLFGLIQAGNRLGVFQSG